MRFMSDDDNAVTDADVMLGLLYLRLYPSIRTLNETSVK